MYINIIFFKSLLILFHVNLYLKIIAGNEIDEEIGSNQELYKIEGKIIRPDSSLVSDHEWFGNTKVFTNIGLVGFLREDGSFVINNVPWGSHVIQVMNPTFNFEAARVDISSKGKIRARTVNQIQPSKVDLMVYPLRLKSLGPMKYFQQRETWKMTDFLFNPMVLMTVVPLVFMLILPRLGDAETRKEMEQIQMPKMETPELSEIITNFFGGGGGSSSAGSSQPKTKPRPGRRKEK